MDQHQGESQSDAGQAVGAQIGGVADVDAVDDVVEGVDDHAQHRGNGELEDQLVDGFGSEWIVVCLCAHSE